MQFKVKAVENFVLEFIVEAKSMKEARKKADDYVVAGSYGWRSNGMRVFVKQKEGGDHADRT